MKRFPISQRLIPQICLPLVSDGIVRHEKLKSGHYVARIGRAGCDHDFSTEYRGTVNQRAYCDLSPKLSDEATRRAEVLQ